MAVYHVVLMKLKANADPEQVKVMTSTALAMVGVVPGLLKFDMGHPLAITAARAKGYNFGLVAILEKPEHLAGYAVHPAHQEVLKLGDLIVEDKLAFDLEF